jgi:hypothetical protein
MYVQEATFKTVFFDSEGNKLDNVSTNDANTILPKFSRVSTLSQWSTITQGTYGASLKPKAFQMRVYPSEGLPDADNCYLDDEDEAAEMPDMLGGVPAEVVIQQRPSTALPKSKAAPVQTPEVAKVAPKAAPAVTAKPAAKATKVVKPPTPEPVDEDDGDEDDGDEDDGDEVIDEGDAVDEEEAERVPTPEPVKVAPRRTVVPKKVV